MNKAITFLWRNCEKMRPLFKKMRPHLKKCDLAREICGREYFACVLHYPAWKKCNLARKMSGRTYFLFIALSATFCVKIVLLNFVVGLYTSVSLLSLL